MIDTFILNVAFIDMFDFIQIETNLRKLIYLGFEKFPVPVLEISSLVTQLDALGDPFLYQPTNTSGMFKFLIN